MPLLSAKSFHFHGKPIVFLKKLSVYRGKLHFKNLGVGADAHQIKIFIVVKIVNHHFVATDMKFPKTLPFSLQSVVVCRGRQGFADI